MCQYCERRTDIKHGWNQPKLPYHGNPDGYNLSGNITDFVDFEGVIHDYQTTSPQLILTCHGYFSGTGVGTVYIPIKYCPECGRKLGKEFATETNVRNDSWIPINKRLPNEEEMKQAYCRNHYGSEFIVMIEDANRPTTLYRTMDGFWVDEKRELYSVVAWQALPEPFAEDEWTDK